MGSKTYENPVWRYLKPQLVTAGAFPKKQHVKFILVFQNLASGLLELNFFGRKRNKEDTSMAT